MSRPEGFHLQALAEPYMTLSRHTAPIRQAWPFRTACLSYLPRSSCCQLSQMIRRPDPPPLLQPHYRVFNAHTGRSAPVSCIGTLASRLAPLELLPLHQEPGSCSSARTPVSDSRPLYAGRHPPRHQAPGGLVPGSAYAPGFDDFFSFNDASSEGLLSFVFRTPTCSDHIRTFHPTLTTTALYRSSSDWFGTCS